MDALKGPLVVKPDENRVIRQTTLSEDIIATFVKRWGIEKVKGEKI